MSDVAPGSHDQTGDWDKPFDLDPPDPPGDKNEPFDFGPPEPPRVSVGGDESPFPTVYYGHPLVVVLLLFVSVFAIVIGYIHGKRNLTSGGRFWWSVAAITTACMVPVILIGVWINTRPARPPEEPSAQVQFDKKFKLGFANHEKKDYDGAIADYSEAIRLDPNNANAASVFFNRGLAHFEKKDYDSAIADFSQAIRLNPKHARAFGGRGSAHQYKQDYDKAIADFTESIQIDREYANKHDPIYHGREYVKTMIRTMIRRGIAHFENKDYDKAIADCSEALRLDSGNATAYYNRGLSHSKKKNYDRAIADYSEAIRLDPKDADTFVGRGSAYHHIEDYDKAIADFTEAIRLDPKNADTFANRGITHHHKGDNEKAIADYSEAIRLAPERHAELKTTIDLLRKSSNRPK